MNTLYISPQVRTIDIDGDILLMQGSDTPNHAYNQYSSDDACAREEQTNPSLWDNEW